MKKTLSVGDKCILKKTGFPDLMVRRDSDDVYSILEYVDKYGSERWGALPPQEKDAIESQINEYYAGDATGISHRYKYR